MGNCAQLAMTGGEATLAMIGAGVTGCGILVAWIAHRRRGRGAAAMTAALLALLAPAGTADAECVPQRASVHTERSGVADADAGRSPSTTQVVSPASSTSSSVVATPSTTTTVPVATVTGRYTRRGQQLVVTDPPDTYPTAPISWGGSGWELPTFDGDDGPVAAATIEIRSAGSDGIVGTSDDVVVTTATDGDGRFAATITSFGPVRVTAISLPVPSRAIGPLAWWFPGCGATAQISTWSITTPSAARHDAVVGPGDALAGLDFEATNLPSSTNGCE